MLSKFVLAVIILVHIFILTKLIYFPYPELFIYPYLTNSGLKPYQQILDQHFPGLLFLPVNFNNLGLLTADIAKVWSVVLVVLTQIMLFMIGKKLLGSPARALPVNFLYLTWQPFLEGWVLWIDSFLPLLLLPAFYFFYMAMEGDKGNKGDKGKAWFFVSGLMLGLGIIFKQTLIPLSGFILLYLYWKLRNPKIIVSFIAGISVPVVLMVVYLLSIGVLKDFWYWTVVFNLTTYAQSGRGAGPTAAHFLRAFFIFGLAFLALAVNKFKTGQEQILAIFILGALTGLSTRFDFIHFQPALPFAVLATVYGLGRLGRFGRLGRLGVISVYIMVALWWLLIFYKGHLGDRIISFDLTTLDLAARIKGYASPGEKIFVFGAAPHLYQMTETLPAGDIFVFQFPWFLQVAQEEILDGIKRDKPKIIVADKTLEIEGRPITEFASKINYYIDTNYLFLDRVGTIEILVRKERL